MIRGDDEYVVWSDTCDRSLDDILMVQDDIAREVATALKASLDGNRSKRPATAAYWCLSAVSGLVRDARQAGTMDATITPPRTMASARAKEMASVALTP